MTTLNRTNRLCRALATSAVTLGLLGTPVITNPSDVQAALPGYNGKIIFTSNRDGNKEIYVMNTDGSGTINLSNNSASDDWAVWSPGGTKISFISNRGDGNSGIYTMNADGSDPSKITELNGVVLSQYWSPDGETIVFDAFHGGMWGYGLDVFVVNADGSNQIKLTSGAEFSSFPVWSPDGAKIIFQRSIGGNAELYTMNSDGTNQVRLTNAAGNDTSPTWSPDGLKIFFSSPRDGNREIYSMNADGSDQNRLTTTANFNENSPDFSPDGSKLSFIRTSLDENHSTLIIANADGSNQAEYDFAAQGLEIIGYSTEFWSPDGKKILLTGYHDSSKSTWDQYIFDTTTEGLVQVTEDGLSDRGSWLSIANTPPAANVDSLVVASSKVGVADVLANDTDEEALSAQHLTIHTQPAHGVANVKSGKINYTPNLGYVGTDQLTYQICDSFVLDQKCSTAVLGITVSPAASISKVGETVYENGQAKYVSSTSRPTFSGTATPGSTVKVEIHSDPIVLTTVAGTDGSWSVTPDQDLPIGDHTVYISATLNGMTTELDSFVLGISEMIPNTGSNTTILRTLGLASVLGGASLGIYRLRSRKQSRTAVPHISP